MDSRRLVVEFRPTVRKEVSPGGCGGGSVDADVVGARVMEGEARFLFRERLPLEGCV